MADPDRGANPSKRRRLSHYPDAPRHTGMQDNSSIADMEAHENPYSEHAAQNKQGRDGPVSSSSVHATKAVASFLSEHIPQQYAPQGEGKETPDSANKDPNTRYCYRHRPDLKCRRKVDEESMDQLQQVRAASRVARPNVGQNRSSG